MIRISYIFSLALIITGAVFPAISRADSSFRTRSTFDCLSIYWTTAYDGPCTVQYRISGSADWQKAQNLYYDTITGTRMENQYRGSIVGLRSGAEYEVKLQVATITKTFTARTWGDSFKIKKTISVSSQYAPFLTTEGGSEEEGYVLYDGQGAEIDAHGNMPHNIVIRHNYVILRGFKCVNALTSAIVSNGAAESVVIDRCEITKWGRRRYSISREVWGDRDYGIEIDFDCRRWVVQGCEIHHPNYGASKWFGDPDFVWGHTYGPYAIFIRNEDNRSEWEANHVIRYNAIYSDATHMFDDAIGGYENFSLTGFPGADSDIYGNRISHAWDDLIEADGGGQNVRIWGNYLEYALIPVSFQSLTVGPVYYFRNVIAGSHYDLGVSSSANNTYAPWALFKCNTKKNSENFDADWNGPLYAYHNTSLYADGKGWPEAFRTHAYDNHNIISRNNVFMTHTSYLGNRGSGKFVDSSFDYDLHNKPVSGNFPVGRNGILAPAQWREGHGPVTGWSGNYQLEAGSPGYNGGIYLPNFNLGDNEEGGRPDMGAHEYGSPPMLFGPEGLEDRLRNLENFPVYLNWRAINSGGDVLDHDLMWINITFAPWIYVYRLNQWVYIAPEWDGWLYVFSFSRGMSLFASEKEILRQWRVLANCDRSNTASNEDDFSPRRFR